MTEIFPSVPGQSAVPVRVKEEPREIQSSTNELAMLDSANEQPTQITLTQPPLPSLGSINCRVGENPLKRESSDGPSSPSKRIKIERDFDLDDVICCGIEITPVKSARESASLEFDRYLQESIPIEALKAKEFNPLNWWSQNAVHFPMLSCLARKYLCVPATSTPSERVFSTTGNLVSKKRSMLSPETVDKLVFLHANY